MTTFHTRYESLPASQRELLPDLRGIRDRGFTLYGGTALALRLGHRESVDFDFFSNDALDRNSLFELSPVSRAVVTQDEANTLSVLAGDVKLSFFGNIRFGRVGIPAFTDDSTLLVASIDDIFATKVKVLLQRVEAKDYLDIAALLESGASLERGLGGAQTLYGSAFQPIEALRALTYFEEGDLERVPLRLRRFLEQHVSRCGPISPLPILSRSLGFEPSL